ncbi:DUF2250 domain-containing protein [Thermococcus sp. CX2]|uniref:DUF2250 domain-containing protein n=1 Tax=Thermococcus sp. CX2 TaxID=163006 RepID=UPI00143AD991|nr:DUF2250 domain-containing protein [Thermococcus sp. CX2]NJE85867.1 DUF2250 domain-containing protein [Thermococcus sp. CX2]
MSGENTHQERQSSYRGFELLPVHLYVLLHLKRAGVDYAKMMARMTELDVQTINDAIRDLIELGLVERDSGSAIKRSKARFKKAFEVHKHHTYYRLSRRGDLLVRSIDERWLKSYFNGLFTDGWRVFRALAESSNFGEACRRSGLEECDWLREELLIHHFITPAGRKTSFFKLLCEFLGL